MAKYKYKLKEAPSEPNLAKQIGAKIGDVTISKDGDTKYTVVDIDKESGQVSWDVVNLPALDKLFDDVNALVDTAKGVVVRAKQDTKFRDFFETAKELRNKIRTHLRKEYPDEYQRMTMVGEGRSLSEPSDEMEKVIDSCIRISGDIDNIKDVMYYVHNNWMGNEISAEEAMKKISKYIAELEEISTSAGAGSYLSKYAFAKKVRKPKELEKLGYKEVNEGVGANLGPGPKASEEGVKDNYYVKKFKYKLVPKNKDGNYVQKGSGLEVKNF